TQFIPQDQWQAFKQEGGLVLGAGIARSLDINVGDEVTLLLSQPTDDGKLAQPLRFSLTMTGILRLDGQLDHSYALLPIAKAQELLELKPSQYTGIELAVKQPFQVREITFSELANYPQQLYMQTWIDKFGYMYNDIQLIRTVMYIA
ncbi:lipoprotein-releasing system transmembrane subunit LolE, partial [Glaesserella parasuis]